MLFVIFLMGHWYIFQLRVCFISIYFLLYSTCFCYFWCRIIYQLIFLLQIFSVTLHVLFHLTSVIEFSPALFSQYRVLFFSGCWPITKFGRCPPQSWKDSVTCRLSVSMATRSAACTPWRSADCLSWLACEIWKLLSRTMVYWARDCPCSDGWGKWALPE